MFWEVEIVKKEKSKFFRFSVHTFCLLDAVHSIRNTKFNRTKSFALNLGLHLKDKNV